MQPKVGFNPKWDFLSTLHFSGFSHLRKRGDQTRTYRALLLTGKSLEDLSTSHRISYILGFRLKSRWTISSHEGL